MISVEVRLLRVSRRMARRHDTTGRIAKRAASYGEEVEQLRSCVCQVLPEKAVTCQQRSTESAAASKAEEEDRSGGAKVNPWAFGFSAAVFFV